jgi:hypothetical protein
MGANRQSRAEIQSFGNWHWWNEMLRVELSWRVFSMDYGQESRVPQGANECSEEPGNNPESHVKDRVVALADF